jgi:MATE family multidrug resistance protein
MLYAVVDTVLTGHASATDLAAMGLGTSVYSSVFASLLGALNALNPIIAQYHGGGRHRAIGVSYVQGLWLALVLSSAGGLVPAMPELAHAFHVCARLPANPARFGGGGGGLEANVS